MAGVLTVAPYNKKTIAFYEKADFVLGNVLEPNLEHAFPSGKMMPEMEMFLWPK